MNLIWFLTIGVLLSILPGELGRFPFGSSVGIRLSDLMVGLVMIFGLIWQVGIKKQLQLSSLTKWVMLFWLVGAVSLLVNWQFAGAIYLIRYMLYSGLVWIGYLLVKSQVISLPRLINWLVAICIGMLIGGVIQLIFFPNFEWLTVFGYDPHQYRLAGTLLDPNYAGCLLSIGVILSWWQFEQSRRRSWLWWVGILSLGVLVTFSRSAYLMWGLVMLVELWRNFKIGLGILIVGMVTVYLLVPRFSQRIDGAINLDKSSSARFESWQRGGQAFLSQPVVGVGFNNLRTYYLDHDLIPTYSGDGGNAGAGVDSSLLFVLATTGVIGLIAYLVGPIWLWWQLRKSRLGSLLLLLLLALLLDSLFVNSLFYPPVMLILWLLLGAIEAEGVIKDGK